MRRGKEKGLFRGSPKFPDMCLIIANKETITFLKARKVSCHAWHLLQLLLDCLSRLHTGQSVPLLLKQAENKLWTIHTPEEVRSCTALAAKTDPLTSHLAWSQSKSGYPSPKLSFDILASLLRPARFLAAAHSSAILATMFFPNVFYIAHRTRK